MIRIPHREANPKIAELKKLPVFAGLNAAALRSVAINLDEVKVAAGEKIMVEGHGNDAFWIILAGQVELTLGGRIHEVLDRGDIFGLPSMFTRRVSTADVVAKTEVRALVASHGQFGSLVSDPEVEIRFKAAMFDRLRDEVFQLTQSTAKRRPARRP